MRLFILYLLNFCLLCVPTFSDSLQHGKYYHQDMEIELSQYFVSEKLDGFRGYWDGKVLKSKTGYAYNPPEWFIQNLGDQPLDGELWLGRDQFSEIIPILNSTENQDDWHKVSYMIFDMPNINKPFKGRVEYMENHINALNLKHVKMIPQQRVQNKEALNKLLENVVALRGEGLMLHHEDAYYGSGRVNHLLKVKKHDEGKGIIIGYKPGKGKYTGMVGALVVELEDGMIINVGSGLTDEMRANPPKVGETIAFIHNGLTNHGKPRFTRFKRMRNPAIE